MAYRSRLPSSSSNGHSRISSSSSSGTPRSSRHLPSKSPPSLIFSDCSEVIEDTMATNATRQDANVVMQKVLEHLDQVVEHLRDKNENEAANEIAISTISIVKCFNNATAPWDIEKFYMNALRYPIRPAPGLVNGAPHSSAVTMGSTWAAIAATEVDSNNKWIKFRPSDGLKRHVGEEEIMELVQPDQNLRVIWVAAWGADRPLAEVTNFLSQGPIFSMVYSPENNAVCVIFQHASSVQTLLEDEADHRERYGVSMFGEQCHLVPGLPYEEDEDLRRMSNPVNERRRLTFARSQLFAHGMNEEQFKRDIYQIVGEQNVELVWLFNTGNATVVFTSTAIARRVRDQFWQASKRNGPYQDVHISFSHDPCEKPMNLITQIQRGPDRSSTGSTITNGLTVPGLNRSNSIKRGANGVNGSKGGLNRTNSNKRNQSVQIDADGWQTVGKRR